MHKSIIFTNRSRVDRCIWIEPECFDYWVLPGQTFEVKAMPPGETSVFEVELPASGEMVIFPASETRYIAVFCEGLELPIGYQRPPDGA